MRPSSRSTAGDSCSASNDSNGTCAISAPPGHTQRKARRRRDLPTVALVGYTNAGKSTLLNQLTHAGVLVENQLFSTLDPTTRRLRLPGGETVLLSDTVGFVRRLPHQLVDAFRSTLEEVVDADLLLHIVDASSPDADGRIAAVETVLREIEAGDVPVQLVWNKADLADPETMRDDCAAHPDSVAISAATGTGIGDLLTTIGDRLASQAAIIECFVPYDRADVLAALHRSGEVLVEVHDDEGTRVRARLPAQRRRSFRRVHAMTRLGSAPHGRRSSRGLRPASVPVRPAARARAARRFDARRSRRLFDRHAVRSGSRSRRASRRGRALELDGIPGVRRQRGAAGGRRRLDPPPFRR